MAETDSNEIEQLFQEVRAGNRVQLARAITLVESRSPAHRSQAVILLNKCQPYTGNAWRIAISGPPGVGKSTMIEALGQHILKLGKRLAVLAIDPTSTISDGSILGDKTRMPTLSRHPSAFIRPSPTGLTPGGIAERTREASLLCEAAGYDVVLIETVGVGQSETLVHAMVDCFILMIMPGAGDDLQGIKRGIVELADLVVVNKADENRLQTAQLTKANYANALHFLRKKESDWAPVVQLASALNQTGITDIWETVSTYFEQIQTNGYLQTQRLDQSMQWLDLRFTELIRNRVLSNKTISAKYDELKTQVADEGMSLSLAVSLFDTYLQELFKQ